MDMEDMSTKTVWSMMETILKDSKQERVLCITVTKPYATPAILIREFQTAKDIHSINMEWKFRVTFSKDWTENNTNLSKQYKLIKNQKPDLFIVSLTIQID